MIAPTACTSRKKCTMFSGRVSSGRWPRMTIRSKQWYTNASRLPNSRASIGPLASVPLSWHREHGTEGRWRSKATAAMDRTASDALPRALSPAVRRARGNFKYVWLDRGDGAPNRFVDTRRLYLCRNGFVGAGEELRGV